MTSSVERDFAAVFPEIVETLKTPDRRCPEPEAALAWFKKVLEYNVPFGKKNRGEAVVTTYCHLAKNPTEADLKTARILGWALELLHAYFLVTDDIMDKSETRRGLPCWYKKEEVGLISVNDSLLLEAGIYRLLKKYIGDKPYYHQVLELFLEAAYQTAIGQCLDVTTAPPEGTVDFSDFNMDKHAVIVKWKTSFYTCYMPVALALCMAGVLDETSHNNAKTIMLAIGEYYQIQDDYLDCYGDPETIGKIGTDIQDNKCSWLIVQALQLASPEQREILQNNYGRWDERCVQTVKKVFQDLKLHEVYQRYEDKCYLGIIDLINRISGNLPKAIFVDIINKLHKRSK